METRIVYPGKIGGILQAPASKSVMQRAIACAMLAPGISRIHGSPLCDDSKAAVGIIQDLGAKVREEEETLEIIGSEAVKRALSGMKQQSEISQENPPLILQCGESGLCMRMFAPISALLGKPVELRGSGSLVRRPMDMAVNVIRAFGASCESDHGFQPLRICGPLTAQSAVIDAQGSSQLITGLLMALPLLKSDSNLQIKHLVSTGYLDVTLRVCAHFGVFIRKVESGGSFIIQGGQNYHPADLNVEGDWSAAAFLAVAAAIAGTQQGLSIKGLKPDSAQPDRAIREVLAMAGARIILSNDELAIVPQPLHPFSFDASECPDIFPPLVVLASAIHGRSRIDGVHRLVSKESDRAKALMSMVTELGIHSFFEGDGMVIDGDTPRGGTIASFGDHRIAMAGAILALVCSSKVSIVGAECVSKSWPDFFEKIDSLRAR